MTGEGPLSKSRNRSVVQRDATAIASDVRSLLDLEAPSPVRSRPLLEIEDRRTFSPVTFRPPATVRRPYFLVTPDPRRGFRRSSKFSPVVGFDRPEAVLVCVRRHRRREVLFAAKKAGRGGMRRPRRGPFSSISCRRPR